MDRKQIKESLNMNEVTKVSGVQTVDTDLIDLALFDLMSDRKSRDINEVLNSLTLIGFNPRSVNNRMDRHLSRRDWFDRSGSSRTYYTLKKHTKRPKTQSTFTFFNRPQAGPITEAVNVTTPSFTPIPSPAFEPMPSPTPSQQDVAFENKWNPPIKEHVAPAVTQVELPQPTSAPVETLEATKPEIFSTDTAKIAVWKYLSDGKPATVVELMAAIKFISKSSIVNTVCKMQIAGQVTSELVEPGKPTKSYTMVPGTPSPEQTHLSPLRKNLQEAAEALNEESDKRNKKQKDLVAFSQTVAATQMQDPEKAEAKALVDYLDESNRGPAWDDIAKPIVTQLEDSVQQVKDTTLAKYPELNSPSLAPSPVTLETMQKELERVAKTPMEVKDYIDTPQETARVNPWAAPNFDALPLLSVGIQIKGVPYTVAEARELTAELTGVGFGAPDSAAVPGPMKHLGFTIKIAGMDFTPAQANELAMQLLANKLTA